MDEMPKDLAPSVVEEVIEDGGDSQEATEIEVNDQNWFLEMLPAGAKAEVAKESWRIKDPDAAQWAEERYYEVHCRKRVNDLHAEAKIKLLEDEINRLRTRNEERNRPFMNALAFFEGHLLAYVLNLRAQDENVKSYKGLYLEVSTRALQDNFEVADKPKFIEWLTSRNKQGWFDLEVKPKKTNMKKEVGYQDGNVIDVSTGEIIDGLIAEPAHITAKVVVKDEINSDGAPVLRPVRQMYVFDKVEA